jgi:AcrR family transcriptional regulator
MSLPSDIEQGYDLDVARTTVIETPPIQTPGLAAEQRDVARSRILRAAMAVLARRGLDATVDDVAEEAGVNRRTVFRHFATRDGLFAAAIREGVRRYAQQLPAPPESDDLAAWLLDLLLVTHRLNAGNGRVYLDLAGLGPDKLTGELAEAAAERREARRRFAAGVTARMWRARGGRRQPPAWLVDAVAVHLSGFTTLSLTGDFGRTPEEVARVSAQVLEAALTAALGSSVRA